MARATKCLLFLLLSGSASFAQFKNIKLDEISSTDQRCEPGVAINRKNPNNIVATTGAKNIHYTLDGGLTWQVVNGFGNAVLASDDKGDIYSFYLAGEGKNGLDQLRCQITSDGGKTWASGAAIGAASKEQYNPGVTIDAKGNVWVAWTQFDNFKSEDDNCQSNILLSSSSNGKKWSKPFQISQTPGNCKDDDNSVEGAVPAIGADGKAFVTWSNQDKIFLDRSFSGGGLWLTNDIGVGPQHGGWDMKVPGYERCSGKPILMINQNKSASQGTLYLVWADQRNGENDTDIWFMRSTNFGDNWTSPMKLGEDKNKRHQYSPWMTVDQSTGYIYVLYFDRDAYEDDQTDVILAYSTDNGSSFKSVKISETSFNPAGAALSGRFSAISAHKGIISPVWTRVDESKASVWTATIKQSDLIKAPQISSRKKK
jgi:hypothetical protein